MKRNFNAEDFINKLKQNCKLSVIKEFQADEIITTFLLRRNQFCILVEGEAQLITYDKDGNKKILYYYKKNDIFGEDEFEIEIPDDEIENIRTVGALVSYIEANS